MKINRYQIVVLSWGVLIFLGYFITTKLNDINQMAYLWGLLISLGCFIQVKFMWFKSMNIQLIHTTWFLHGFVAGVLTYLALTGKITTDINIHVFWLGLTALGMFTTAFLMKNSSYIIMGVLYLIPTAFFQIQGYVANDMVIVGAVFLTLGIVDGLMEYSPMRKRLANFIEERVI